MSNLLEYVHYLTKDAGARPANTEEEYHVAKEIERLMKARGLETNIQEFPVPVFSGLAQSLLFTLMALVALLAKTHQVMAIICLLLAIVCLVLFALEYMGKGLISRLSFNGTSQNVVGRHPATAAAPDKRPRPVVIVANYDSPHADLLKLPALAWLEPYLLRANRICMVLVPLFLLLNALSFIPQGLRTFVWVLALIAAAPLLISGVCGLLKQFVLGYVQGANDNASGVAALLGVLDRVRPNSYAQPVQIESGEEFYLEEGEGFVAQFDDVEQEPIFDEEGFVEEACTHAVHGTADKIEAQLGTHEEDVDKEQAALPAFAKKKTIRRGAGVARAAGVLPPDVPISYVENDNLIEPSAPQAQVVQPVLNFEEAQGAKAAEAQELASAQEEEQGYNPRKEQEARRAAAQKQSDKPLEVPVRSRFADLPIDYKRSSQEKPAGAEGAQSDAEAAIQAAVSLVKDASQAAVEGEMGAGLEASAIREQQEEAQTLTRPANSKTPGVSADKDKPRAELAQTQHLPLEGVSFEAEEIALPHYDAKSAVDAALKSGRIKEEPLPELKPHEQSARDAISLVSLKDTKSQLGGAAAEYYREQNTGYDEGYEQEQGLAQPHGHTVYQEDPFPGWGQSSYKPKNASSILDLPDPSISAVDPYNVADVHPIGEFNPEDFPADEFATGTFVAQRSDEQLDYEIEMPKESGLRRFGDKIGSFFSKKEPRSSRRGRQVEEDSLSDWLGVEDDFNAKKDGRKIGSWDNFADEDEGWRGGATFIPRKRPVQDAQPDEVELQEAGFEDAEQLEEGFHEAYETEGYLEEGASEAYTVDFPAEDQPYDEYEEDHSFEPMDRREAREAIMALGDSDLTSHEIWFVASGASSYDHAGVKAFLQEYKEDLRGAFVIHVRAVGAGQLSVTSKEGAFASRHSDRRLVNLVRRIGKEFARPVEVSDMSWTDTEATAFMRAGHRSVSLMGLKKGVPLFGSWSGDTVEGLDEESIASAVDIITETIRRS